MPSITYLGTDGTRRVVSVPIGTSVMRAAIENKVNGIEAQCGGALSCATCHIYVDPHWVAKMPEPDATESAMLAFVVAEQRPASRLSCQIKMTEALDGLLVVIPDRQSIA